MNPWIVTITHLNPRSAVVRLWQYDVMATTAAAAVATATSREDHHRCVAQCGPVIKLQAEEAVPVTLEVDDTAAQTQGVRQ